MNITGIIRVVSKPSQFFSTGDIVAVIVAFISLAGVLISTIYTNRTAKKMNTENRKQQERWNQKNIDASLKANARIEWIQKVRNTTAALIAAYFKLLKADNSNSLIEDFINAQEKAELLILYFGPESTNSKLNPEQQDSNPEKPDPLLNAYSNEGKNDQIVKLVQQLADEFDKHYENIKKDKLKTLNECRDYLSHQKYLEPESVEKLTVYDNDGNDSVVEIPEPNKEYAKEEQDALKQIQEYNQSIGRLKKQVKYLRDVIRIYLKIEWNRAKKGK